jgi:methyltransferase-like protein
MYTGHLARHVADALERVASDLVQMEQYMDFVRNRLFRQTLLCHQGVPIDRELKPAALGPFHIASPLVPVDLKADVRSPEPLKFQHPASQQEVTTAVPLMKAAMICLAEAWPASLPFPKLLSMACSRVSSNPVSSTASRKQDAHFLGKSLLECYVSDMVELHSQPPSFTTQVSDRPLGSRVARVQIDSNAKYVTNLRHESGALSDGYRHVLRQLDGTRDRAELGDIFRKLVRDQILVLPETTTSEDLPTRLDRALDLTLYYLACNALLCTNPPGAASSETIVGAGLEVQQRR